MSPNESACSSRPPNNERVGTDGLPVLIADPDAKTRGERLDALTRAGFAAAACRGASHTLQEIAARPPAVALICDRLPDLSGNELCRLIKIRPDATGVLTLRITGLTEIPDAAEADGWISSTASPNELVNYTRILARLSQAERRCRELDAAPPARDLPDAAEGHCLEHDGHGRHAQDTLCPLLAESLPDAVDDPSLGHPSCEFQCLIELAPEPIGISRDDRWAYVNPAFLELAGARDAGEVLGRSPVDFIHPDDRLVICTRLRQVLDEGRAARCLELRMVRLDGSEVPVEMAAARCDTGGRRAVLILARDITRTRRIEKSLRFRERKLRLIMDSAPALISYIDAGGRYQSLNKGYRRLFGVAPEDLRGHHVREFLGDAAWKIVSPFLQRALAGEPVAFEREIPYAQGGPRWVSVTYTPDRDDSGAVRGVVAQVLDIGRRKAAELELSESEQRFRQIAETIGHVFWMTELNPERVLYVSPAFGHIWGRPPEELYADPRLWLDAIHPEDRTAVAQAFEEWIAAPASGEYDIEYRIIRPDGMLRWISDRCTLVRDDTGRIYRVTGIAEDITARKQLEQALRASERFKQGVLDSLPAHVAVLDADGTICAVNEPWRRFGRNGGSCSPRYEVGTNYLESCRNASAAGDLVARKALLGIESVLSGAQARFQLEYPCHSPDHPPRWFLMHVLKPATDADGVIVTHQDMSSQKRVEQALRNSQADLEQAQAIGQIGSWRLDVRRNLFLWSDENHRIFGIPAGAPVTYTRFLDAVHPDDRDQVNHAWSEALTGDPYDVEHRIVVQGRVKWVRERAELEFERNGTLRGAFGTTQDITERKQAEHEIARLNQDLQRRIHELETIFATVPIGLAIAEEPGGRRIRGNPANHRMLEGAAGAASSHEAGRPAPVRWLENGRELPSEGLPLQRAARGECVAGQVLDVIRPNGTTVTLFSTASPLFDEQHQPRGAVGAFIDITPLKRAEEALRISESRFRAMIQAVPSLTFECDVSGNSTFSSESWYRFTGMTAWETAGRGWAQALHPDDRAAVAKSWTKAMRTGALYESKHRLRRADGVYRWFIARALPLRNVDGVILRWTGSLTDIDDLVRHETALRESEARIRNTLESLPQLVWTCKPDGRCDYLSPQWLRYTGLPERRQLGRLWLRQIHRDDRSQVIGQWREAAAMGLMFEAELRIRRTDGAYHWFQSRAVPLRDETGCIVKWLGTASDIEDLKRADQALREADRRKDEFLAMLSHELRNPLAPIRSATAILRRLGPHDPELLKARDILARQVDHMTLLVDDLLDVSRITRGQIALKKEALAIADVVAQGVEASLPAIESRRHRLSVSVPSQTAYVEGDLVRLVQVVTNLLRNAAKYTDENGEIRLTVEIAESKLLLRVADNGMGIQQDLLPRIFDVFAQGPRALDRSQGGLGIGLSLARQLVEMHGGTIEARSGGPGQGSEFTVCLPRLAAIPVSAPSAASPPLRSAAPTEAKRILVVDDNRDAAQTLAMLLTLEGHEVREAHDGPAAIETARGFHPQIVLLDIGLPGMDGFEVAEHLRSCPEAIGASFIALSGYAEPEMLQRSSAAGFRGYLVKPVETNDLLKLLTQCTAERPEP